ncbi:MAG: PLD nuclease N-terminal domain-containing protein [Actinoplanes sp.]
MAEQRKRWDELPGWQQAGIVAVSAAEIVLTTMAVVDLVRRPRTQLRGPKTLWALSLSVQPFGPIAYLALARRR